MFNYYWQDRAFYYATASEVLKHLQEINNMIIDSGSKDHYYKCPKFLSMPCRKKKTIYDLLFTSLSDKQFVYKVLPNILRHFTECNRTYLYKKQMDDDYPKQRNAFLGPKFSNANGAYCYIVTYEQLKKFREKIIIDTITGTTLKQCSDYLLKHVVITSDAAKMALPLGNKIGKIFEDLIELEKYIQNSNWNGLFRPKDVKSKVAINISDESDATKQDPFLKGKRRFPIPLIGSEYCFLHIKAGDIRMHIYPDEQNKTIYVPYIGPHLPTKKYH